MKANAKKLLALIMAMVMCLSLAAPAMAAGTDAAATSLSTQEAVVFVTKLTGSDTGFTVTTNTDMGPFKWSEPEKYPTDLVKVTSQESDNKRIGVKKQNVYHVEAIKVQSGTTVAPIDWLVDDASGARYALTDSSVAWTALGETEDWYTSTADDKDYQVKGSYYQEQQVGGKWVTYFKLYPTKTSTIEGKSVTSFKDDAKDSEFLYAKTAAGDKLTGLKLGQALATATMCDKYGDASATTLASASIEMETYTAAAKEYSYDVIDCVPAGTVTATPTDLKLSGLTGGQSVSFKLRATYDANKGTGKAAAITAETDAESVKTALTKLGNKRWTVNSVGAADANGYFAVTLTKAVDADDDKDNMGAVVNNTLFYNVNGVYKAGLEDLATDGVYVATGTNINTAIKAGTKLYGQVAVKNADLVNAGLTKASTGTTGYRYWDTEAEMQAALDAANDCTSVKTISYVKLIMNKKNGTADANTGVTGTGADRANAITVVAGWAADSKAYKDTASYSVPKSDTHAKLYTETSVVDPTCKKTGVKTTKSICKKCGTVVETKEEVLPIDQSSVEKTTKDKFYVVAKADAKTGHYIEKYTAETTLATKDSKGAVVYKFFCNHGEEHTELGFTDDLNKTALEHSGKWDYIDWSIQNTASVRSPSALYGFTATICDTDVDVAGLPIAEYTTDKTTGAVLTDFFAMGNAWWDVSEKTYINTDSVCVPVVTKLANGAKSTTYKTYGVVAEVKNIKNAEKSCLDGSATIELRVYELDNTTFATAGEGMMLPSKVADYIAKKKATLLQTYSKDVVVPAEKTHIDANGDGKCDNCDTEIKQDTTEPEPETKTLTADMVTVKNLTYTGKKVQPEVTVKTADGTELDEGLDYQVATFKKTAVGTYTITVKGMGDWTGKVKAQVKIKKAANPVKVSTTKVTFKVKNLKKKAQTAALKVTKAQGKVTAKSSNKNVSWKSNLVTAKKGLKKGTYKLTFKAKGNSNYKAKTVTVKVVVK